jgi:hypothetical protein
MPQSKRKRPSFKKTVNREQQTLQLLADLLGQTMRLILNRKIRNF